MDQSPLRYCQREHTTFTRNLECRKKDNCFVEQKNNSVVSRFVGYYRFDTAEQLALLNAFYEHLRLCTSFFLPVMRLKEKHRTGSRLTRRDDEPRTPCRRLLNHPELACGRKELLEPQYARLDIVTLKRELKALQAQLFESVLAAPPLLPFLPWDFLSTRPADFREISAEPAPPDLCSSREPVFWRPMDPALPVPGTCASCHNLYRLHGAARTASGASKLIRKQHDRNQ